MVPEDIRDKVFITHDDVVALNFIKDPESCFFKRHFRQGLRSHIMEIIKPEDRDLELNGVEIDGVRWYPKAKPFKIFRIFRAKLKTLPKAMEEIERVKIIEWYLAPEFIAKSEEFVVDYKGPRGFDLMLCGLQAYVEGAIVDPWGILDSDDLMAEMYHRLCHPPEVSESSRAQWIQKVQFKAGRFISRVKQMILEKAHVPDLAGVGNLVMVPSGEIKLVDMNNISRVGFDSMIRLDDRGYPVCDKSIEALSLLEAKLLGRPIDAGEPIYRRFLDPQRKKAVQEREGVFHRTTLHS